MVETLSLFLGIGLLLLLLAIPCHLRFPHGSVWRFRRSGNEHSPADEQAKTLLRELLSEKQYLQLRKFGYLEVVSPSIDQRIYRIPADGGMVQVYECGHAIIELCLQPAEPLPESDVVLMHKLMIEANEQEYLQKANHFAPGFFSPQTGFFGGAP